MSPGRSGRKHTTRQSRASQERSNRGNAPVAQPARLPWLGGGGGPLPEDKSGQLAMCPFVYELETNVTCRH